MCGNIEMHMKQERERERERGIKREMEKKLFINISNDCGQLTFFFCIFLPASGGNFY